MGLAAVVFLIAGRSGGPSGADSDPVRPEVPESLARDPDLARADEALAAGDPGEALRLLARVRARFPGRPEPVIEIARVEAARQDMRRAIAVAEEAIRIAPRDPRPRMVISELLEQAGDTDQAEKQLTEASALAPRDPEPEFRLGRIAEGRRHNELAMSHYRRALELDPKHTQTAHYLALQLRAASRYEEAIELLERALVTEPTNGGLRCNLAHIHLRRGDAAKAAAEFRRALPSAEEKPEAWYYLGRSLEALGKDDEARHAFRNALEWDPGLHMAWYSLAQLEQRSGHDQAAKEAFQAFDRIKAVKNELSAFRSHVQKHPTDAAALLELARQLLEAGYPREARATLVKARAVSADPAAVEALLERAAQDDARREERLRTLPRP